MSSGSEILNIDHFNQYLSGTSASLDIEESNPQMFHTSTTHMELPEIPQPLRSCYTDTQLEAFDSSIRRINEILSEPSLLDPLQEAARVAFVDVRVNRVLSSMSVIAPAPPAYEEVDSRAVSDLPAHSTANTRDVRKQDFHWSLGRVLRGFSRR